MSAILEKEIQQLRKEVRLSPPQERTLTPKQKEMIRARDGHTCQWPEPHRCNGNEQTLHVHHITPFTVAVRLMGLSAEAADDPRNLISVCEEIHIGGRLNPIEKIIHADTVRARRNYYLNKNSYQEMFEERERLLKLGQPYHRSNFDFELKLHAFIATNEGVRDGTFSQEAWKAAGRTRTRRTGPAA